MPEVTVLVCCKDILESITLQCIQSLKAKTLKSFDLIVLETVNFNHPTDINKVFRILKTDCIVLVDNDVIVLSQGWLEKLLEIILKDEVGQVQALIYPPDKSYYHAQTVMGNDRFDKPADFLELSYACTAFTILKKSVIEEIGEMDANFMKWCFDIDYSWRIKEKGYRVLLDPRVEAYHLFGETINRNLSVKREAQRHDYEYFYQKWIVTNRAKQEWYRPDFFNGWWR